MHAIAFAASWGPVAYTFACLGVNSRIESLLRMWPRSTALFGRSLFIAGAVHIIIIVYACRASWRSRLDLYRPYPRAKLYCRYSCDGVSSLPTSINMSQLCECWIASVSIYNKGCIQGLEDDFNSTIIFKVLTRSLRSTQYGLTWLAS